MMVDCGGVNVHLRRANPDEAGVLTEIAHAAKRHWSYPESWIEYWREDVTRKRPRARIETAGARTFCRSKCRGFL